MAELSIPQSERSRKNVAVIFSGLQRVGQVTVAKALSVSEGTVSKIKSDDVPRLADMLAVCNLKVVPEGYQCYDPKTMEAILVLAREKLNRLEGVHELEWESE